jgi:epoxide hydrolase-like predicted phosphatase
VASSQPIRAVVWDLGGVLITPLTVLLDEIAEWHGISMVAMLDVLMGPRATSTPDHPWHRAERGELPTAALQEEAAPFAEAAGLTLRGDEYARLLSGEFDVRDEVLGRIRKLRDDGITTALLTNSFEEFRDLLEARVDFGLFDVVIDSSEVGCRKPEPEIYRLTTDAVAAAPEQIVYLDDFEDNLTGGAAIGWHTIHFQDVDRAMRELDELLTDGG